MYSSPGKGGGGGVLGISSDGDDSKDVFWVLYFQFWKFLSMKIWQVFFLGRLI